MIDIWISAIGSLLASIIGFVFGLSCRSYMQYRSCRSFKIACSNLLRPRASVHVVLTTRANKDTPAEFRESFLHVDTEEVRAFTGIFKALKFLGVEPELHLSRSEWRNHRDSHLVILGRHDVNTVALKAVEATKGFPEITLSPRDAQRQKRFFVVDNQRYSEEHNDNAHIVSDHCVFLRTSNPFSDCSQPTAQPRKGLVLGFGNSNHGTRAVFSQAAMTEIVDEWNRMGKPENFMVVLRIDFNGVGEVDRVRSVKFFHEKRTSE